MPFYLEHADSGLHVADSKDTDQLYLLQALCGLVVAAKKVNNVRLMQTIGEMGTGPPCDYPYGYSCHYAYARQRQRTAYPHGKLAGKASGGLRAHPAPLPGDATVAGVISFQRIRVAAQSPERAAIIGIRFANGEASR